MREAVVVVDVQVDFCEGGALAVEGGNDVAERVAKFLPTLSSETLVVLTKDWHEAGSTNGGHIALPPESPDFVDSWPIHCIAGTEGARLHPALRKYDGAWFPETVDSLWHKGYGCPSYSGFDPSSEFYGYGNGLNDYLRDRQVTDLTLVGLASDYCVKFTALDAVDHGFNVRIMGDLTAGIAQPLEETLAEVAERIVDKRLTVKAV